MRCPCCTFLCSAQPRPFCPFPARPALSCPSGWRYTDYLPGRFHTRRSSPVSCVPGISGFSFHAPGPLCFSAAFAPQAPARSPSAYQKRRRCTLRPSPHSCSRPVRPDGSPQRSVSRRYSGSPAGRPAFFWAAPRPTCPPLSSYAAFDSPRLALLPAPAGLLPRPSLFGRCIQPWRCRAFRSASAFHTSK